MKSFPRSILCRRKVYKNDVRHVEPLLTAREIKHHINLSKRDGLVMGVRQFLSKENIVNGIKSSGKLRIKISQSSLMTFSALTLILFIAFTIRTLPIRWEIQTGEMHLSEFDPYYWYSLARYMVKNGLVSPYWPTQWVDHQRWYPDGINMAGSLPGVPMTEVFFYSIASALGINIDLMSVCALEPVIMGTLACLAMYFLGKDFGGPTVGLLSALFLALTPSYIQRTELGFADDETVGIFALLLCAFMFLRAIERERTVSSTVKYSLVSAAALGYFISGWGGAYYGIGLLVLFALAAVLLKRYTSRLLLSYSITFGFGLFMAINVPYLSTHYLTGGVVLPVAGVFVVLCFSEIFPNLKSAKSKMTFVVLLLVSLIGGFGILWGTGYLGNVGGKFMAVIDPLVRAASPLIESVAEHHISAWSSVYYDLGIMIVFSAVGIYFVLRDLNDRNLFLLIFGLTSLYFAFSMARLLLLFAPAFGLLASLGVIGLLKPFVTLLREPPKIVTKKKYGLVHVGKEFSGTAVLLIFLLLMTNFAFSPQSSGVPNVYGQAYTPVSITAGSLPIAPSRPVEEWLDMCKYLNDLQDSTTVVCAWWDYGYWLSILGNVTSLADNATINSTQIENIGFILMANETQSLVMLKRYDAKYILVFTTLALSQSSTGGVSASWAGYGDEGKWTWMARISGKARDRFVKDSSLGLDEQSAWTDETKFGNYSQNKWVWNNQGTNSTIYKLMSWGKQRWCDINGASPDEAGVEPQNFTEAYFAGLSLSISESYGGLVPLVCLYKIDYPSQ
jgi:dolichyl-diphosphooligosaccharide--protein glycosyltransferase